MTAFFIPGNSPARSEQVYTYVVRYVQAMLDCEVNPVRICALDYTHEGKAVRAAVGEIEPRTGQLIIAILRSDAYLICTPYYGVQRGEPIRVEPAQVQEVEYFEGLDNACERLANAVQALEASRGSIQAHLRAAADLLERVGLGDFPAALAADFLSLQHKLSWRGSRAETIDRMSEDEAEGAAAAMRALLADVLRLAP